MTVARDRGDRWVRRVLFLLLAGGVMLYHLPMVLVIRDVERTVPGLGGYVAALILALDLGIGMGILLAMGQGTVPLRQAVGLLGVIPLSFWLWAPPAGVPWGWLAGYLLYAWVGGTSSGLFLLVTVVMAFQLALQGVDRSVSWLLARYGELFGVAVMGEVANWGTAWWQERVW